MSRGGLAAAGIRGVQPPKLGGWGRGKGAAGERGVRGMAGVRQGVAKGSNP